MRVKWREEDYWCFSQTYNLGPLASLKGKHLKILLFVTPKDAICGFERCLVHVFQ